MSKWDQFDFAFNCPTVVTDETLRQGYQAAYAQVRAECDALDLPVGFIIRSSTMLDLFIKHQQTKSVGYGDDGGYANPAQEKDAINALQAIARDYDELLIKSRPKEPVLKGVPEDAIRDALVAVLRRIDDPELRVKLQMQFVHEFEKLGV